MSGMDDWWRRSATLSPDGLYRFKLTRYWGPEAYTAQLTVKRACFVMLNPSTADAIEDDPTIRRCVGFATREGCLGLVVFNLCSYRSKDPKVLKHVAVADPVNDYWLREAGGYDLVVAAWGARGGRWDRAALPLLGTNVMCLGTTKAGFPKHPLYLAADTPLVPYLGRP